MCDGSGGCFELFDDGNVQGVRHVFVREGTATFKEQFLVLQSFFAGFGHIYATFLDNLIFMSPLWFTNKLFFLPCCNSYSLTMSL